MEEGQGAVAGVDGPSSDGRLRGGSSIASNRWPRAARARVPVIPSPRQGGMELCGRSRAGSIKRATTPPGGGHDIHEHAPGCARAVPIASLAPASGSAPGRRAGRSRPGQQLACGGDWADAAPVGDAVEVGGLLASSRQPLHRLDRGPAAQRPSGPADQPGALLGDGPRRTVMSDSRWWG
jgi:hypothetical protein